MSTLQNCPNVIIFYADDLGFGDLGCYGGKGIPTPYLDQLAEQSQVFYNAHAAAATCTPSRYSILTGSYPWRNKRAAVVNGDAKMIIDSGSPTLASMFRDAGYTTGVVGKWHLGLGEKDQNWNGAMDAVPLDIGFDYSFIMPATNDRVPCVYLEGRHVVGLDPADPLEISYDQPFPGMPTGKDNPELLTMKYSHGHDMAIVNGISRIGYIKGGQSAWWKDEEMGEVFLEKAVSFVREHQNKPFFLYYALHQPHVPRVPGLRFAGKSGLGPRGDVIMEMDWCVGQVLNTLDELGLDQETIIIFSSDNGPVLDDGYQDQAAVLVGDHKPAGPLRGGKYSMYDGGTRTPFILRWPKVVEPGESDALVGHVDLYASFAQLLGQPLPQNGALDSLDLLDTFLGNDKAGRVELVTEGLQSKRVLRQGEWVYLPPYEGPAINVQVNMELGHASHAQLYNLGHDLGQQQNLAQQYPGVVWEMDKRLTEILKSERTR